MVCLVQWEIENHISINDNETSNAEIGDSVEDRVLDNNININDKNGSERTNRNNGKIKQVEEGVQIEVF